MTGDCTIHIYNTLKYSRVVNRHTYVGTERRYYNILTYILLAYSTNPAHPTTMRRTPTSTSTKAVSCTAEEESCCGRVSTTVPKHQCLTCLEHQPKLTPT